MAARKKKLKPSPAKTAAKAADKIAAKVAGKVPVRAAGRVGALPLPPLLGGVPLAACLLALLAACAGFFITLQQSDSGLYLFVGDAAVIYRTFLDATRFGFPLSGWRLGVPGFYFPDYILFFTLASVLPLLWAMPVYFYLMISASAAGWMMVCRDLGGGAKIQAAAWLVHILQLLLWSYPGNDIFAAMVFPLHHTGIWVCLPWLLWAVMDWRRWKVALALSALLGMSDLLVVAWFVLPAWFALAVASWLRKISAEAVIKWAAVVGGGVVLGRVINNTLIPIEQSANTQKFLSLNFSQLADSAAGIWRNWVFIAGEHRLLTIVWVLFVLWLSVTVWRRVLRGVAKRKTDLAFRPLFVLLFIPAAMACPTIAQWLAGLEITHPDESYGNGFVDFTYRMRYVFPFVLLPLFVGWCLVPLYRQRQITLPAALRAFNRLLSDTRVVIAAAVLLIAFAAPRIALAFTDGHIISPFSTPFASCVREAANRLGWTGGIGAFQFWSRAVIDPDNPMKQNLVIERTGHSEVPAYTAWDVTNRHWYSGEFAAVAIDSPTAGKRFYGEPRDWRDFCQTEACRDLFFLRRVSGNLTRYLFGEPAEVVECEGVPIFHYEPPISLDFSNRRRAEDYPILHRPADGADPVARSNLAREYFPITKEKSDE